MRVMNYTDQLGIFTLLYEFTDSGGNIAIPLERTIAVVDKKTRFLCW